MVIFIFLLFSFGIVHQLPANVTAPFERTDAKPQSQRTEFGLTCSPELVSAKALGL